MDTFPKDVARMVTALDFIPEEEAAKILLDEGRTAEDTFLLIMAAKVLGGGLTPQGYYYVTITTKALSVSRSDMKAIAGASYVDYFLGAGAPSPCWYLDRLLVSPPEARGQGIRSTLLRLLKAALASTESPKTPLVVTLGRYGSDSAQLEEWYCKQGFKPIHPGLLVYRP